MPAAQSPSSSAFEPVRAWLDSTAFHLAANLVILVVVLFWVAAAFWVHRDARRRVADTWLVGAATLLGLVPFAGPLAWLLVRPAESLADARERRLELSVLESRLARLAPSCPACRAPVEESYLVCPVCTERLRERCVGCGSGLEPHWEVCPRCAAARPPDALADGLLARAAAAGNGRRRHGLAGSRP